MSKYAVIIIKGKQYKVQEGDEILIDKLSDKKIQPDVLLFVDNGKVKIGKPRVNGVRIKFKVTEDVKGKKLTVMKYKAKSRYRRKIGFRPSYSKLVIEKISI